MAETVEDRSAETVAEIGAAAVRLQTASRESDAALVIVSAREAPVAEDLRLVMSLTQLGQHQALIANQLELNVEVFKTHPRPRRPADSRLYPAGPAIHGPAARMAV